MSASAAWAASLRECENERDAAYRERDKLRAERDALAQLRAERDALRVALDALVLEIERLRTERDARDALAKAVGAALVSSARDVLAREFDRLLAEARKGER